MENGTSGRLVVLPLASRGHGVAALLATTARIHFFDLDDAYSFITNADFTSTYVDQPTKLVALKPCRDEQRLAARYT
jgi:hypothetical protein